MDRVGWDGLLHRDFPQTIVLRPNPHAVLRGFACGTSNLSDVLPHLQALHPAYRIEFDVISDPEWSHTGAWHRERRDPVPVDNNE